MTVTHLGETFDIHGGGKDLIFPHHENEIAQSQGAVRRRHVRALLDAQRLPQLRRREDVEVARQRLRLRSDRRGRRRRGAALLLRPAPLPLADRLRGRGDPRRRPAGRSACGSAASRRPIASSSTSTQRSQRHRRVRRAGRRWRRRRRCCPRPRSSSPDAREALADDFNTPVVMAALHEAADAREQLLDEGKGIDKQLRRRTLARLGRTCAPSAPRSASSTHDPSAYLAERRARLVAPARDRRRRSSSG